MTRIATHHGARETPRRRDPILQRDACGLIGAQTERRSRVYDRLAPNYDRLHRRWLRHAGGEAQAALEGAVRAIIRSDMDMLDLGCGTGAFVRRLVEEGIAPDRITLVDTSQPMLDLCADLPSRRVCASMQSLPFAEASFDLVTCAWALETVLNRRVAIDEMLRVVRPRGWVCVAVCADTECTSMIGWIMRRAVEFRRAGCFLQVGELFRAFAHMDGVRVRRLPSHGPAATMLVQRTTD